MKTYWGNVGIAPRIFDLGTRWRWVVSFTPLPHYPQGKSRKYSLGRRLGGPQSRYGHMPKSKIPSPRRESNRRIPVVQPVVSRYTDWAIPALTPVYVATEKNSLISCSVSSRDEILQFVFLKSVNTVFATYSEILLSNLGVSYFCGRKSLTPWSPVLLRSWWSLSWSNSLPFKEPKVHYRVYKSLLVEEKAPIKSMHLLSAECLDRFWGPPSLLSSGYRRLFPRE
jgi:hypothetical protein